MEINCGKRLSDKIMTLVINTWQCLIFPYRFNTSDIHIFYIYIPGISFLEIWVKTSFAQIRLLICVPVPVHPYNTDSTCTLHSASATCHGPAGLLYQSTLQDSTKRLGQPRPEFDQFPLDDLLPGDHSKQDQIMFVKIGKYTVFHVYRRSYLLWSPVIQKMICCGQQQQQIYS